MMDTDEAPETPDEATVASYDFESTDAAEEANAKNTAAWIDHGRKEASKQK